MAYVNLINQVCSNKAEAFSRFRDFVGKRNGTYDYSTTGIGWTLIDESYTVDEDNPQTGDWVVFHSTGESGTDDLYFKFTWGTTDFSINGYLYWNSTTHVGLVPYGTAVNNVEFNLSEINVPQFIFGDLDSLYVVFIHAGSNYIGWFGRMQTPFSDRDDTKANCTSGALSSGSDVSITLDSVPSQWAVGRSVFIWSSNSTTSNVEKFEIKTIAGNIITGDLTKSYSAGAKLSQHNGYACSSAAGSTNIINGHSFLINAYGVSGAVNYAHYPATKYTDDIVEWCKPDPLNSEYSLVEFSFGQTVRGIIGVMKNTLFCNSTGLNTLDVLSLVDGTEYRVFQSGTTSGICMKEV